MEDLVEVDLREELAKFDEKCHKRLDEIMAYQAFWREAIKRGIEVPWDATHGNSRYVNVAKLQDEMDTETGSYPLDTEATQRQFALVVKWARENGWKIEKKYADDEFTVRISEIHEPINHIEFYSTRQVVCKKVQTGTKMVEAVEAHEEPIYEYICDKVAFLTVATD